MAHWEGHVARVCVLREHLWLLPRFGTIWEGSPVLPRALGQRGMCLVVPLGVISEDSRRWCWKLRNACPPLAPVVGLG